MGAPHAQSRGCGDGAAGPVFREENPTGGWATLALGASYVVMQRRTTHALTLRAFNLTSRINLHTSFIKDLAPEMGRGVRLTYTVNVF